MTHDELQAWLDRYVEAWKTYDPQKIASLFSEDIEYRYHPNDEPEVGRDLLVSNWLDTKDDEGTYDAQYQPVAIDPDGTHVANGWSRYYESPGGALRDEYWNVYIMRFNDKGECSLFTEYWIQSRDMRKKALEDFAAKRMAEASEAGQSAA